MTVLSDRQLSFFMSKKYGQERAAKIAEWMINEVIPILKNNKLSISDTWLSPEILGKIIDLFDRNEITRDTARYLIKGYCLKDKEFEKRI